MAVVGDVLINIKARSDNMVKGLNKARARIRRFRRSMNRTFGGVAKMATVAGAAIMGGIVVAMRAATSVFADFEAKMAETKAVLLGISDSGFKPLIGLARELGATTSFTASEAAEAMTLLARAGFNVNEIMTATSSVMNLAAASGQSLAEMADTVAVTIRSMGLEADQAARVADVLALASARANTDVLGLGNAFSYVGPIAKALGVNLEKTTALLGTLSDAGMQADKAGTGLRSVMATLADEIGPGGLDPILDKFVEQGLGAAEAFAQFGKKGAPAILALGSMRHRTKELETELVNAKGAAEDMAGVRLDTIAGSFALVKSAAQEMMIVIGEALAPAVRDLAESLRIAFTAASGTFTAMMGGSERSTDRVRVFADVLISVVDAFGLVADIASKVFNVLQVGFYAIKTAVLAGLTTPLLLAVTGIETTGRALNALGIVSDETFEGMRAAVHGFAESIAEQAMESVANGAEAVSNLFGDGSEMGDKAREFSALFRRNLMREMTDTGESAGEELATAIKDGMSSIVESTEDFTGLADATEDVRDLVQSLTESNEAFGKSTEEMILFRAAQEGVSEELIKQAEALMKRRAELEKNNELMEEGKRLAEQMRTPHEKYADTIKRLNELLNAGAITQETFGRAVADAESKLASATDQAEVSVAGPTIGSIETALGDFNFGMTDKNTRIAQKSLTAEEKQVALLEDIKRDLGPSSHTGALT